jgi:hypothetical protein
MAYGHMGWGIRKWGLSPENCRAKSSSENSWNRNVFLFVLVYECCSFIKGLRPEKIRLIAHCVCRVQ